MPCPLLVIHCCETKYAKGSVTRGCLDPAVMQTAMEPAKRRLSRDEYQSCLIGISLLAMVGMLKAKSFLGQDPVSCLDRCFFSSKGNSHTQAICFSQDRIFL